ncbi:WD40 domain-containing protein [Rubripirellula reticaptiva]|uniref:Translocation protein TolB n=1 Tax=Rubripirellula reticaptiva TaxID=2528013 RepID=A0A5C6F876_9BACT|nr:c-type cytochrome domain-containing protein [Rubripirellula reticaptiva]TWU57122.1 translocation protein TolB [Rubripirellula reticaptiva]
MKQIYILAVSLSCFLVQVSVTSGEETATVSFRSDIAPILLDSCLACHGPKKAEGGYRVDTYKELLKAGDSGELPIAASPDQVNELLRRVACDDESERMPAESEPLAAEQIELIRKWIAAGGKFDGEDAGQSLTLVIPPVKYADPPEVYSQAIPITATIFSPDGKLIVTSGYHELVVWNTEDAKLVRRIKNVGQRVFALAFSSDGQTLAVGCGEPGRSGEVRLVDFNSGEIKGVVARTNDVVLDIAYRPGTNELAIASSDSTIRIVDVKTLQEIRSIASHADWVTAVAWSDDGTRLASASRDKSAKVYDGATGELLSSYLGHGAAVRGVSILADNKQVVSVGADNKLHRWNVEGAKKVAEVGVGGEGYKLIRNGTDLFVPCSDHRLLRIDLATNKIAQEYKGHSDWVLSACYQPNTAGDDKRNYIASSSFSGEIRIWNIADAAIVRHWIAKP